MKKMFALCVLAFGIAGCSNKQPKLLEPTGELKPVHVLQDEFNQRDFLIPKKESVNVKE